MLHVRQKCPVGLVVSWSKTVPENLSSIPVMAVFLRVFLCYRFVPYCLHGPAQQDAVVCARERFGRNRRRTGALLIHHVSPGIPGPPNGRLQRKRRTERKYIATGIRSLALALPHGEANHWTSQLLMNNNSAKFLKNRTTDAKFLAHYTVAFIFSNYLKTCHIL